MDQLVRVTEIRDLTPRVKSFAFRRLDKKPLLPFGAGAHLQLTLTDPARNFSKTRSFSLTSGPHETDRYEIAVLLPEAGGAGSAFMHENVKVGRAFNIGPPIESFNLAESAERHLFIAAGIGITPFVSMAKDLKERNGAFQLHYIGVEPGSMAYLSELQALCGPDLIAHHTRGPSGSRPDLKEVVGHVREGCHLYVCGPADLMAEVFAIARMHGWPDEYLHCESFSGSVGTDDAEFKVRLARQGTELMVEPGTSILDAILQAGVKVPYDCKHGTCGACTAAVLEGKPSHRDPVYSTPANQTDKFIRICVSRSLESRLVLDL